MPFSITDEIIDAIIQNERRHVCRPLQRHPAPRTLQTTGNRARLKPDWTQLPPGDHLRTPAATEADQGSRLSSRPAAGADLNR